MGGFRRFILWDYPRAGWQYDVMVSLILVFIFLTPRDWFRDQPKASSVVMVPAANGTSAFWIEPDLLAGVSEAGRAARVTALVRKRTGKKPAMVRLEPIFDSEQVLKGYMAFTTP
ncbi:MAG: hypothetical protein ABI165_08605 [Bryobacteraceae bacterium]